MTDRPLTIVILGLTVSSSWGNGHATTYRALLEGLAAEGHEVLFLERDRPWYASHRDLPEPQGWRFALYDSVAELEGWGTEIANADAVIAGSYLPEAEEVIRQLRPWVRGTFAFYDIDTPVTLEALEAGSCEYLTPELLPLFDTYLSFSGGRALDKLLALGARRAAPLYCSVDAQRYRPMEVPRKWDLGYLGTYSPDRQPGLEALLIEPARRLPQKRFVVAGPQYPGDIDWPENVERIEHLGPADHAAFYNAQAYTLNITRSAMRALGHSPSVRLFEAAACGTPIISDRWEGLGELLPESEAIVIADGTEDVVAALTGEGDARIGQRAREIVLAGHTGRARARDLVARLHEATAQAEEAL
ncbi:CgeB family protein [Pseudoroseicyclus tamaricis]|uniref:Glycosyltransferase n=1 Tax=Pseudoroseicyclus tamaricis TaxID=2705421 RepID=A0A6B2JT97_9RHOB|nr:glycosyltransferase [Pseudoroseicyclus tamaricis]NDU99788.1 glycosyltransferase [Pseudoroseicyclus tamaricis]